MGRLRRKSDSARHELTPTMGIGRAASAGLRLSASHVSLQHASVRWTERGAWELRDLQSKNGTFVNGQRIAPGAPIKLELGAELGFGSVADVLVVEDVSPPRPMLLRLDAEAEPIFLRDGMLALPSLDEPTVSLFMSDGGQWYIDSRERTGVLSDGDMISVGSEHYRCSLPTAPDETEIINKASGVFSLAEVRLCLTVSRDEEQVDLTLSVNERQIPLGIKACHYLLLTLVRRRLGREQQAASGAVDGWIAVSDLLDLLRVSEQRMNVDIFRIRQELKSAGVVDALAVIERDTARRRLRLGTTNAQVSQPPVPASAGTPRG
jgi:FHA domain-containing protein